MSSFRITANGTTVALGLLVAVGALFTGEVQAQDLPVPESVAISVRGGLLNLDGDGQLFDMMRNELTFGRSDLQAPAWSLEASVGFAGPVPLNLLLGWESSRFDVATRGRGSAVDGPAQEFNLDLERNLFAGVRIDVARDVRREDSTIDGPNATWRETAFFVTLGGGWKRARIVQEGVFPDGRDLEPFSAVFQGTGSTGYVFGGVGLELSLSSRLSLLFDARYQGGSAYVDGALAGFERVDLSGLTISTGLLHRW